MDGSLAASFKDWISDRQLFWWDYLENLQDLEVIIFCHLYLMVADPSYRAMAFQNIGSAILLWMSFWQVDPGCLTVEMLVRLVWCFGCFIRLHADFFFLHNGFNFRSLSTVGWSPRKEGLTLKSFSSPLYDIDNFLAICIIK